MTISDQPVVERTEDVLGRWGLARTIFDLISSSTEDASLRIGVYGGWGEGKTSVLRMVESQARRAHVPVCWFSVWSAETQRDLWSGLVDALTSLDDRTDWKTSLKTKGSRFLSKTKTVADVHSYTKTAHALVSLAAGQARVNAKDAQRTIERLRAKGRVLVLVDDVDRVDTALVPKLLMGLHELFEDLQECAVVVALDPEVVSAALGQTNAAWMNGPSFLEKIVQYPFWLARPDDESLRRLIMNALRDFQLAVLEPAILDIVDLMPRNPRRLKQFIRSLSRLRATIARFGEDEWNPPLLVLLDLLRVHSAEVAEQLLNDRNFLHDFVAGNVLVGKEDKHDTWPVTKAQAARVEAAVQQTFPRAGQDFQRTVIENIVRVVNAASETLYGVTSKEASRHASLDTLPPVMTMREFDALHEQWSRAPSAHQLKRLVSAHSIVVDRVEPVVLDACLDTAVRRRGSLIDEAAEALHADDATQAIQRVDEMLDLLRQLVDDLDALGELSPSRIERFLAIRNQTTQFANRLDDEVFAGSRTRQREFLYSCAKRLDDRAPDVLNELKPWDCHAVIPNMAGLEEITGARERLQSIFAQAVAEDVLIRFRRRGAIAAVANFMSHPAETWVLLDRDSPFHQETFRSRLKDICYDVDAAVSENCLKYLRMLTGSQAFSASTLSQDADLIVPLWTAVARMSPRPRMHQVITDLATRLRHGLADPELIPLPAWVQKANGDSQASDLGSMTAPDEIES